MEMPKQVISKHNPAEKSLKAPFTVYLDLECILKKVQSYQNNPEKPYTEKLATHEPSGCLKNVYSTKKKINLIITEEKIVFKYSAKN